MNFTGKIKILIILGLASIIQPVLSQDQYQEFTLDDSITVTAEREGKVALYNTTATKLPLPIRQTPISIGVLTRAVFETQNSVVLSDALSNFSGINVQNGNGVHDYFIIRGFNSLDNGLVLTDGTAEPEVTFYNLYNIERVEVLKSPGAFLYGANPLSGTVNLVRKQPQFNRFVRASGSYGSFNSMRGTLDANIGNAELGYAFRLNGMYQQSDFFRENKENDSYALNPAFTWQINDRATFHADYEYAVSNYSPDAGIPVVFGLSSPQIADVDAEQAYETPFDESEQTLNRFKGMLTYRFSQNIALRNKTYFTDLDWQSRGTLLLGAYPDQQGNTLVSRLMNNLDDHQKLLGNQLELLLNLNTGGIRHKIVAGVEYSRLTDDYQLGIVPPILQPGFPGLAPVSLSNPADNTQASTVDNPFPFLQVDAEISNFAPYLLNYLSLSSQVQFLLGARADNVRFDDNRIIYSQVPGAPDILLQQEKDYNAFSPVAGVAYSPRPDVTFYGNIGRAFAPPSALIGATGEAEESNQLEFGIKAELLEGRLKVNAAFYDLRKDDFAISQNDGTAIVADQQSTGVELGVIGEVGRTAVLFVNYSYTDAELSEFIKYAPGGGDPPAVDFDYSGNRPAFAPQHLLNVYAINDFANGLSLCLGGRFTGSQFIDEDNQLELDSYLTFEAGVFYRISNSRIGVNLKNITGTDYFTRGYDSYSVIPGNPFAAYGTVEIGL